MACHQVGPHLPGWLGETIFVQDHELSHSGFQSCAALPQLAVILRSANQNTFRMAGGKTRNGMNLSHPRRHCLAG